MLAFTRGLGFHWRVDPGRGYGHVPCRATGPWLYIVGLTVWNTPYDRDWILQQPGKNGPSFAVLSRSHGLGAQVFACDPRLLPQTTYFYLSPENGLLSESVSNVSKHGASRLILVDHFDADLASEVIIGHNRSYLSVGSAISLVGSNTNLLRDTERYSCLLISLVLL